MVLPNDLSNRVRRRLRALNDRARYSFGLPGPNVGRAEIARGFRHPVELNQKTLLVSRYREFFATAALTEVSEARRFAAHRFHFLGHAIEHGGTIAWSQDPVSGREWSRGFSPDIVFRGPGRLGDIKLPWELNKHQYFFTLGKAGWLTGEASFALEILAQIDHWITDNPCGRGINWISALETGTRAVAWIMAFPFFSEFCDTFFRERLARSLTQHMLFVERHLSTGRYANTHLIGEAAALVAGGLFLDCSRSARWVAKGLAVLEQEIEHQVTSDGVHVERSVAYHRFFLDQYYLVEALLHANGQALSSSIRVELERMTGFLMDMLLSDGHTFTFGDCDDARGVWTAADCMTDYRSHLTLGAVLFQRGDFKAVAGGPTEELLWLMGDAGLKTFTELPERLPRHNSVQYPDAGYYVMRGGWHASDPVLVFDCGPLGYGPAGHGHADALSFQLYAKGYPFLVDSGTFSYNLDYSWRDAFRSTRAHNTVAVDGRDQSVVIDRMSWSTMATARCHRWLTTPWFDLIDGDHDGYDRLPDPVSHRRVVVFIRPDVWLVFDQLEGLADHVFEFFLHLRPDCSVCSTDDTSVILESPGGSQLYVSIVGPHGKSIAPEILMGNEAERGAWFSPVYGTKVPTRMLRLLSESVTGFVALTCLSTAPEIKPALINHDSCVHVEVRNAAGHKDRIVYRQRHDHPFQQNGITFDGEIYFSREALEKHTALWATDFRQLAIKGLLEVRSPVPVQSISLKGDLCSITMPAAATQKLKVIVCDGVRITINGQPFPSGRSDSGP